MSIKKTSSFASKANKNESLIKSKRIWLSCTCLSTLAFAFAPMSAKAESLTGLTGSNVQGSNFAANPANDGGLATALAIGNGTGSGATAVYGALVSPSANGVILGASSGGSGVSAIIPGQTATYSMAIGAGSITAGGTSNKNSSTAIGTMAAAYSQTDTALGSSAVAYSVVPGQPGAINGSGGNITLAGTSDFGATAIGSYTKAWTEGTTSVGQFAQSALLPANIASGTNANPLNANPIIPTQTSGSITAGQIAGHAILNNAALSTAVGNWAIAQGYNGTALGQLSATTGNNATALGQYASATALNATGVGQGSVASGNNSLALGNASVAGSSYFMPTCASVTAGVQPTDCNPTVAQTATITGGQSLLSSGNVLATTGIGSVGDTAVGFFTTAVGGSSTALGGSDGVYNQTMAANGQAGAYTGANSATVNTGATSGVAIGGGNTNGNGALVDTGAVAGVAVGGGSGGGNGATVNAGSIGGVAVGGGSATIQSDNTTLVQAGAVVGSNAPGAIALGGAAGTTYGWGAYASNNAIGGAQSYGVGTIAIGSNSIASNAGDYASGYGAQATGGGNVNCSTADCTNGSATAVGAGAWVVGGNNTAIGNNAWSGDFSGTKTGDTAVGQGAWAVNGSNNTAIGQFALAKGDNNTSVGQAATTIAHTSNSSAFGQLANALGNSSTALGASALAGVAPVTQTVNNTTSVVTPGSYGDTAVGYYSTATGGNSTALGTNSNATGDHAIAIGSGAQATQANQIALGAPGQLASSTASQVGPSNFVTTDSNGTLGQSQFGPNSIASLNNSVTALQVGQMGQQMQIASLQSSVQRGYEGSAVALATTTPFIPEGKRFAISAHYGNFRNQNAIGGSAVLRVNNNIFVDAGVGVGLRYSGVGGRAGATFVW
jgi:trimeric autotransporter adhesin